MLDRQAVYTRIVDIVAQKLKIDPTRVTEARSLAQLNADSLDMVTIVLELEEQFGIAIDDHDAERMDDIERVVDYVYDRYVKAQGSEV